MVVTAQQTTTLLPQTSSDYPLERGLAVVEASE